MEKPFIARAESLSQFMSFLKAGVRSSPCSLRFSADYYRISMHGVRLCLLRGQAKNLGLTVYEIPNSMACSNEEYKKR